MALQRWGSLVLLLGLLVGCDRPTGAGEAAPTDMAAPSSSGATAAAPALAGACPDAAGPISGPIVFGADSNLLSVPEDGGDATAITALPASMWASDPAWSPDGSTLLFTLNRPSTDPDLSWLAVGQICALDRHTGKGRLLAESEGEIDSLTEATWTPDGKALFLTLQRAELDKDKLYVGSTSTVARYELDSSVLVPVVDEGSSPALSSNGKLLSFIGSSLETAAVSLMVADPSGEQVRAVLPPDAPVGLISAPRWSPDSEQIIFTASGDATGASPRRTPQLSLVDRLLGVRVAAAHGAPSNLWLVGPGGEGLRKLTEEALDDPRAAWSPDGSRVAYVVGTGGVFVLDVASGSVRPLTERGNYGGIAWAPR